MNTLQRYEITGGDGPADVCENANGEWVLFSDVEHLLYAAPVAPAAQSAQPVSDAYKSGDQPVADDVVLDVLPASWIETARKAKTITADVCRAYPETAAAHINGLANLILAANQRQKEGE